jgi:tetratricopeptide (TPR) repeat protein
VSLMTNDLQTCQSCGNITSITSNFCSNCGCNLSSIKENQPTVHKMPPANLPNTMAERRQVTLVKCHITPNNTQQGKLVPLKNDFISAASLPWLSGLINEYKGKICAFEQGKLTICFGYPTSHDRIAKNALRFAWKLQELFKNDDLTNFKISILLHSGEAIVKQEDQQGYIQIGGSCFKQINEINLSPNNGNVVITSPTKDLLRNEFELKELKSITVLDDSYKLYKVLHVDFFEKQTNSFDSNILLGREKELESLKEYWSKVVKGRSKIVQIIGEPGIGKSHLIEAFKQEIMSQQSKAVWLSSLSGVYTQNTAFFTIADVWFSFLPVSKYDPPEKILEVLKQSADNINLSVEDIMPLFSSLLTVLSYSSSQSNQDVSEKHDIKPEADIITDTVLEAVIKWMEATAYQAPVVFVMEDIQWADVSSIQFIEQILKRLPNSRIMVVFSFRPDFVPSWIQSKKVISLHPDRLLRKDVKNLINQLSTSMQLSDNVVDYITDKTDGIPFFVQELTRSIIESNILIKIDDKYDFQGTLNNLTIPGTLRESLDARLDKLEEHKIVAQFASVLGRVFSYDHLLRLMKIDKENLDKSLSYLLEKSILYKRDTPSETFYVFRHSLIQEAAYASLLKNKRLSLHAKIAEIYEKHYPEIVDVQPEIIAEHYSAAGYIDQGAAYWLLAGKRATSRSAFGEAITHFNNGLDLFKDLPLGAGRDTRELPLKVALCLPLMVTKGWGAPEVERALIEAHELCHRSGDTVHLITVLRGLQSFFVARGPLSTARDYAEQMMGLARQLQDPALTLESNRSLGHTMFFQGEFESSKKYLGEALRLFDPKLVYSSLYHLGLGYDPKIASLAILSWVNLSMGFPEKSLQYLEEAIEYSDQIRHPFGIVYANGIASSIYRLLDDPEMTYKHARKSYELAMERKYVYWQGWAKIFMNWAVVFKNRRQDNLIEETAEISQAIESIRAGIKIYRESGSELGTPLSLLLLAQCLGYVGRFDEASEALTESLVIGRKNDINFLNAVIFRVKGELIILENKITEDSFKQAEEYYRKSIEIAQQQKSKLLELRTTLRLYELYKVKSRETEIVPEIQKIYDQFTEGFTILKDLIQAHKILKAESPQ